MKNLIYILSILILASCGNNEVESISNTATVSVKDKVSKEEIKPFSNPAIIYGSDFGNYFKTLYKLGKYSDMISFTSSESIEKFGEEAVIEFYKNNLDFGYEIGRPHSINSDGDYVTLNYEANIMATKTVVRIVVVLENDSCKIVLPNKLNNFPS